MKKTDEPVVLPYKESEFRQQVVQLAGYFRWDSYWTFNSIHSPPGFPDIVLLRPPRLCIAELKMRNRKLTYEQQKWIDKLALVTDVSARVWRPEDWKAIEEELR